MDLGASGPHGMLTRRPMKWSQRLRPYRHVRVRENSWTYPFSMNARTTDGLELNVSRVLYRPITRAARLSRIRVEVSLSGPGGQGFCAPGPDSRIHGGSLGRDEIHRTYYFVKCKGRVHGQTGWRYRGALSLNVKRVDVSAGDAVPPGARAARFNRDPELATRGIYHPFGPENKMCIFRFVPPSSAPLRRSTR